MQQQLNNILFFSAMFRFMTIMIVLRSLEWFIRYGEISAEHIICVWVYNG